MLGNCAVYGTCWAWLPQQQAQPPVYFPLEGCPLTIMDYLGHGVWNAWRCPSCAGREGQHLPTLTSLAGKMGLEVRQECGSGHSLLVLTGICYWQDILPWQTSFVCQENVSDIQDLFKFYFFFPLPKYWVPVSQVWENRRWAMGKKKTGSRKEKKWENSFRRNIQSWVMPTILPLNPVHATDEKNASDVIQLKGDKNITNISYAAF